MTKEAESAEAPRALNLASSLTGRSAALFIGAMTLLVTVIGGVLIWLVDRDEFPNLGTGLWWALQTVTTVGYGDVVPKHTGGRLIGAVVMLQGIGFITVVAASVTAALIENARRRRHQERDPDTAGQLDRIESRLTAIESALADRQKSANPPKGGVERRGG